MGRRKAFEDGLRTATAQRDNKDRLQLRDLKEKLLKRFQSDTEFEIISKRIDARLADRKRLVGPDKPELELILEDLPTIRASEKPKILAAAIVRALDAQDEADLGGLTPPWTLYVIRAASNQALLLEPGFSEWEDVQRTVNAIIHKLELAEEKARVDVVPRYYGKKGGVTKAANHGITEDEIRGWKDYAAPRLAQGTGINQIVRQIQRNKKLNPLGRTLNGIYNHFRPKKPTE